MARKKNLRNRRRAAFYDVNLFDYDARKRLAEGQPSPQEIPKEIIVKPNSRNEWTEAWTLKITIVQTTSRKA